MKTIKLSESIKRKFLQASVNIFDVLKHNNIKSEKFNISDIKNNKKYILYVSIKEVKE